MTYQKVVKSQQRFVVSTSKWVNILRPVITVIRFPAPGVWSILSHCWMWMFIEIFPSKFPDVMGTYRRLSHTVLSCMVYCVRISEQDVWCWWLKSKFHVVRSSRLDTTRHVRRVEPCCSTSSTQLKFMGSESCRVETWRAKWNLGLTSTDFRWLSTKGRVIKWPVKLYARVLLFFQNRKKRKNRVYIFLSCCIRLLEHASSDGN